MKQKLIIICLFLLITINSFAQDKWNGEDKYLHFGASFVLHSISYFGLDYFTGYNNLTNQILASSIALSFGIGKEVYDVTSINGTGFSYKDLTADMLGIAFSIPICYFIHQKIENNCISFIYYKQNYFISYNVRI